MFFLPLKGCFLNEGYSKNKIVQQYREFNANKRSDVVLPLDFVIHAIFKRFLIFFLFADF